MTGHAALVIGVIAASVALSACAPRLPPLSGAPAPARLPTAQLRPGHARIVFNWELTDAGISSRGDGAARTAAPDSVRLDFFLAGGVGAGAAVLIGDSLDAPGGDFVRRLIPPPTLLWAALGRAAPLALADTSVRVDGAILRADIGRPVAWRLTFRGDTLIRAERVERGRVREWVERADSAHIQYRQEGAHRSVRLTVTRAEQVTGFDASIWRLPR